jgi:hypothetical protein
VQTIVEEVAANEAKDYTSGRIKEAYVVAQDCIDKYERSAVLEKGRNAMLGSVSLMPETFGSLFVMTAEIARRLGDTNAMMTWAEKAVEKGSA